MYYPYKLSHNSSGISLDYVIVPLLWKNSIMGCTVKGMTPSSMRNFLIQMDSFTTSETTSTRSNIT